MTDIVIRSRGLGKRYSIARRKRADTLARALVGMLQRGSMPKRGRGLLADTFWALRDIDFDIKRGDVVGIVGRNGAGKSTLLKILANVTSPTEGEVTIQGRVGCLLEVGTGFSPDLSGRENIYLSAAILGMKGSEIKRRLDQIVEFADIPGFVDTPVKHYSSGMYMRLAFAVAAHLDHEILLVDEVLAVGDAAFQRKCQQKIGDEANSGRTIFFVSHSLPAVASLCNRALYLEAGKLLMDAETQPVLSAYQRSINSGLSGLQVHDLGEVVRYGNGKARFSRIGLRAASRAGDRADIMTTGKDMIISLTITAERSVQDANPSIIIYDSSGYRLIDANLLLSGQSITMSPGQVVEVTFRLHDVLLKPGEYLVGLWLGRASVEDIDGITYAVSFMVEPDLSQLQHSSIFPGVYQCEFSAEVQLKQVEAYLASN